MRRRSQRERRMPGGYKTLFQLVLALAAGRPVFTADLYVIDGGSGKTRAVVDWNDNAHWLDQANTTLQCALPAAHADFAGKLCFTFVTASQNYYVSTRTAAYWGFPIDVASGSEVVLTGTRAGSVNGTYWFTTRSGTNGFGSLHDASGGSTWFGVAGGVSLFSQTPASGWPLNVGTFVRSNYFEGLSPEVEIWHKGTLAYSGASLATPSGTLADTTLNVGRRANNTAFLSGRLRDLMFFPKLDASGVATLHGYEQGQGIAA